LSAPHSRADKSMRHRYGEAAADSIYSSRDRMSAPREVYCNRTPIYKISFVWSGAISCRWLRIPVPVSAKPAHWRARARYGPSRV
jgi:hypothetical protein